MFTDRRANSLATKRIQQEWPADRPFRILSLDGGGIKGVFTVEFLRACEEHFTLGDPLYKYFDCIAGTSTGGIIALGLSIGMTADEVLGFYRDDGRQIFPPLPTTSWTTITRFLRSWWRPKLNHVHLESALRERFGERLLGEAHPRLVIPAFMMPKTEITVFKTDHHADFRNDHLTEMWKVARATAAAPTYLKGLEDQASGQVFLDGGIWANNPVMVALIDALSAYDLQTAQIEVLSIGTGNHPFELRKREVFGGLIAWKEAIKAAMFLTTDNATAQAKLLLGPKRCLRIEPKGKSATVEMDDYDEAFRLLPEAARNAFMENQDAVGQFFRSTTAERERHYTSV